MNKQEICHVCKKVKKPYTVFLTDNIFSFLQYENAREDGPICDRCDRYYAMTGKFKDATEEEFCVAIDAARFARNMQKWWEKDKKTVIIDHKDEPILIDTEATEIANRRNWAGTGPIASWYREKYKPKEAQNHD